MTGLGGTLTGTADYDTFGAVRASTGTGSVFGYTGEQLDAETGYTYLRARYLNPALGRFNSADTVQPNTPGTQGYNLYAYVANNPTTWVDPSGHETYDPSAAAMTAYVMATPLFMYTLLQACAGEPALQPAEGPAPNPGQGLAFGVCQAMVMTWVTIPVLICALTPGCIATAMEWARQIIADGTWGPGGHGPACVDTYVRCKQDNWDGECDTCLHKCIVQEAWPFEDCRPSRTMQDILIDSGAHPSTVLRHILPDTPNGGPTGCRRGTVN